MLKYAVQLGGIRGREISGNQIELVIDLSKDSIEKAARRLIPAKIGGRSTSRKEFTLITWCDNSYRLVRGNPHFSIPIEILKIKNAKKFHAELINE